MNATTYRIDVEITAPVYPTEVTDRVEQAIATLFPEATIEERHGELVGESHSLDHFAERLRDQEIVAAARATLREAVEGDTIAFELKKQAARKDVVNFAVGEPDELGELHVRIRVDEPDPHSVIDLVAPASTDRSNATQNSGYP